MTHPLVARRQRERDRLLDGARRWAESLSERVPGLVAVVVVGSVARGDFNLWSDIDVVVIADGAPEVERDQWMLLTPIEPGVQPVLWRSDQLAAARALRNPLAVEADTVGVVVWGRWPSP